MVNCCSIEGCESRVLARSWCSKHYNRWRNHGDPEWEPPAKLSTCSVDGCESATKARGYCSHHVERFYRYGDAEAIPPRISRAQAAIETGESDCIYCNRRLPLDRFHKDKRRLTGHKWYCKDCNHRFNAEWVDRNRDSVNAAKRKRRAARSDDVRARDLQTVTDWKKKNPDAVRRSNERRRALKLGCAVGEVDEQEVWSRSGGRCAICAHELSRDTPWPDERFASLDHIVPLAKGGTHETSNLQYACLVCNLRKGTRPMTSTVSPVKR